MGPTKEVEEIPVYMFMGFLESGKTTFANETLIDRGFTEGEPTLLLVCEEGIEEYDEEYLKSQNIFVEYLEESNLNTEYLLDLQDKYKPTRVMIEYNGTWKMDKLFSIRVPKGWTIVQVITFVDASTFDVYVANMKAMMMEQLSSADMIIYNRCDENTKRAEYRRSIRAVNRRAQVIFENKDGAADVGDEELDLPYEIDKPSITLEDEDYGIFYIDACDNPDKYVGKQITFKAMVHKPKSYKANEFVPGRFAMTCCAEDVAFIGFKCYSDLAKHLKDRQWVTVIGHEMTHGFDDQGRQYDKDGNLKDWWTAEDAKNFDERAQVMVNFFDSIEVAPGVYANGRMTLGENIADHGGLQVSYQAFKKATAANPLPVLDGLTPEQRFFLAYAGVWANDIRPEEVLNRTKSDVHSLGEWRVNGALPQIGAWYEAFNVTEKDPMFLPVEKRVSIW